MLIVSFVVRVRSSGRAKLDVDEDKALQQTPDRHVLGAPRCDFTCARLREVDELGRYTGEFYTFALAGFVRRRGESDACLNRLLHEKGLLTFSK